jgi:hypothetical protein
MRRNLNPYWTTARFNSTDANGHPVKKGDRIFYYPSTRTVLTGDAAEKAAGEFACAKQDEDFYASQY